jgi:DNA invertase Pin-like site-specific DNA recombinase
MGHRAAIYCRVSQDREGAGLAVERQEQDCRALAERLGWEVVAVHTDNDLSAYSGKPRPGYQAMLAALRAGTADAVICWHTDRLHRRSGRDRSGALDEYIDLCQARNIPTQTVQAGALDLATASGRMTARIHAAVARGEVEHQIERQVAARRQTAMKGRWAGNKRPFGYAADGVTVDQVEAEALRWAAGQVLAGVALRQIARELNGRGIRSSTGRAWDPRTLGRVLRRPRNAGLSVYRGQVVGPAAWPAILEEGIWRGVVAVLQDPTRRSNPGRPPRWLLTNLARCGVCGVPVISKARARPAMVIYTCPAAAHLSRPAADVDAFVEAVMVERLSRPDARDLLTPDPAIDPTGLHLQDVALAGRLAELGRMFAAGEIEADTLRAGTNDIRQQRERITAELAATSRGSVLAGVIDDMADAPHPAAVWAGLDLSRRRAIIEVVLTVTILPARRGRRPGWQAGESYFDPRSVRIQPVELKGRPG